MYIDKSSEQVYELYVVTGMGEYKREGEDLKNRREECTAEEMDNIRDGLTRLVLCIRPVCLANFVSAHYSWITHQLDIGTLLGRRQN